MPPSTCCPAGPGVSADYLLMVTAQTVGPCPVAASTVGPLGYAGPCLYDPRQANRPTLGTTNLCPGMFFSQPSTVQLAMAIHELHHGLVSGGCLSEGWAQARPGTKARGRGLLGWAWG